MTTIECENLVHIVRHMNKDRRAGLMNCGSLIEFRSHELGDACPTCVTCVGFVEPACVCTTFDVDPEFMHAGHSQFCPVVKDFAAVDDRVDDVVYWCIQRGEHNQECDDDGFCQACGYQFEGNLMRTSPE